MTYWTISRASRAWRHVALATALAVSSTCTETVAPAADTDLRLEAASPASVTYQPLTIILSPSTIEVGASITGDAIIRDANGTISRPSVRWRSSDPAVATVEESTGIIRGVSAGTAYIRALGSDVWGQALLTVVSAATPVPPPANGVAVDEFERLQLGPNWRARSTATGIVGAMDFGALALGPVSADWAGTPLDEDQFSEIVVSAGKDPNMMAQVHVRHQRTTGARYGFHYNPERSPAVWEIKYDGVPAEQTRILARVAAPAPVAGDVIRIEAKGRGLTGYVNGKRILSATDNSASAVVGAGSAGITARPKRGSVVRYPTPIASTWRGGSLKSTSCTTTSEVRVALTDLGTGCYLSFSGGLYPDASNTLSGAHLDGGIAAARRITPLDVNGVPSARGKYVLLSIGMSNTSMEFCTDSDPPPRCEAPTFAAQAAADPAVNKSSLVIVNGALGGRTAPSWTSASSAEYNRIRDTWLTPLGLSEKQVQVAWVKVANRYPTVSLPSESADAYTLMKQIADINRALRARYPNLRQVFVSSRIYAGYATIALNPEPYAYESAFGVKWAIQAQIDQMRTGVADARTGNLNYDAGTAAWMAWGPYLWADGTRSRSDGLSWVRSDFMVDGTHPAASARQKVGSMLLTFFKTSPTTSCWFVAGRVC